MTTYAKMHLYPPTLPQRLRVEVATAIASGSTEHRPVDVPERLRRSAFDPPFRGGERVDVLLEGSAVPGHRATEAEVSVRIGEWSWAARVFGARKAVAVAGRVAIGDPLPIEAPVSLGFETAFGGGEAGIDERLMLLDRDFTTGVVYPRNPWGVGYRPTLRDGSWDLPKVEDPSDLLTGDRLEQLADEGWVSAPLPWCLDEVHGATFPRAAMLEGVWPTLDWERATEVRRGLLDGPGEGGLDPRFLQDAPAWAWLSGLPAGTPIEANGVLPRGETFTAHAPAPPVVTVHLDGGKAEVEMRPRRITLRPDMREIVVVWSSDVALPRPFLPGIHKHIPIAVELEGHAPVAYPTPGVLRRPGRSI